MEAAMPSVDQETQQIISTYQIIYNLIFKYGTFIVLAVISFAVILSIKPSTFASDDDITSVANESEELPTIIHSGNSYIAKGVTLAPAIVTDPLQIDILQGYIDVSPEAQEGYGALASLKGIFLPMYINLTTREDGFSKEYFSSGSYNPEDLKTFMENNILTYPLKNLKATIYQNKKRSEAENALAAVGVANTPNPQGALPGGLMDAMGAADPLATYYRIAAVPTSTAKVIADEITLVERFGLQCLGNAHITNFFCFKNTELFISRIPHLDFTNKLEELLDIVNEIVHTPYKKKACDHIQYAFSKDGEAARGRELVFSACGPTYMQAYRRIVDFSTVTYELQGISNEKLYADDDINIFKLLSLQQKIYHSTLQKNYDLGTIEVYLSFIQDLLTKRQNIPQIYKDMVYLFNNTYLQGALTQLAILNNNTKAMLRLSDVVKNINEGGSVHLQRMIKNQDLITYVDASKGTGASQDSLVTFQDLFANKFTTFDSFIVTSQKVNNDDLSAQVEGYFLIEDDGEEKKVLFIGDYVFQDNDFTLTSASFPQSSHLESALNGLIKDRLVDIDIPFVYEFIRNNNSYTSANIPICDLIGDKNDLASCTNARAVYDDGKIRIIISFEGYKIVGVSTTDSKITQKLRNDLIGVITTQSNISATITALIRVAKGDVTSEEEPEPTTSGGIDTNEFTIISKFKKYLDVTPQRINLSDDKYIVEFSLSNIEFIAAVDIKNNYKVFPIAIQKGDTVIRVNNLSLNLTNAAFTEINQFKADPWAYIMKVDPAAYQNAQPDTQK